MSKFEMLCRELQRRRGGVQCFEARKQNVTLTGRTVALNKGRSCPLPIARLRSAPTGGSELEILRDLTIEPRAVLVETRGVFGRLRTLSLHC